MSSGGDAGVTTRPALRVVRGLCCPASGTELAAFLEGKSGVATRGVERTHTHWAPRENVRHAGFAGARVVVS